MCAISINSYDWDWSESEGTRRERLKSALYLRLKKRKTFFGKKLVIIEKIFSFKKSHIVPKNVKGGTLWGLLTYIQLQNIKLEGGPF